MNRETESLSRLAHASKELVDAAKLYAARRGRALAAARPGQIGHGASSHPGASTLIDLLAASSLNER